MDDDIIFYSVKDSAKMLSISISGIRQLIREGKLKSVKFNEGVKSKQRIPKSELLRLQSLPFSEDNE